MNSYNSPITKPILKSTQIVWYVLFLIEIFLALRFVFKLTGANPFAVFTTFIYWATWPLTAPFLVVFPRTVVEGSEFEWTTLLTMFVYWMIALALVKLILMSKTVSTSEAAVQLENK